MATLVAFKPGGGPEPDETGYQASHLLRIIEHQPACLMRVGIDGTLLAVNDAALKLLGVQELSQILNTPITKLMVARFHEEWELLTGRIREGSPGSLECDLTDLTGVRRSILLQAIPLLDHRDGVPSMIAVARDRSLPRRLEASLRDREVTEELGELQRELQIGVATPRPEPAPAVDHVAAAEALRAAHASELARLRQTLAEDHQLALLLKDQELRRLTERHRGDLEQATAECRRLTELLAHHDAEQGRASADRNLEVEQLRERLALEHQQALDLRDEDAQRLVDAHREELARAASRNDGLATELEQTLARHAQLAGELTEAASRHQALASELQDAKARHEVLTGELEGAKQQNLALTGELVQAKSRHEAAAVELEQATGRQATLSRELEYALAQTAGLGAQLEQANAEMENLIGQLAKTSADSRRADAVLEEREAHYHGMIADHVAARNEAEDAAVHAAERVAASQKALADLQVKFQVIEENARHLEWLAGIGRAGFEIGRELQTILEAIDARSDYLLARCAVAADERRVIEELRGDAMTAGSLVRQIAQPNVASGQGPQVVANDTGGAE